MNKTPRLYQIEDLTETECGEYILLDEYDRLYPAKFAEPRVMYVVLDIRIGIKGYYRVSELPVFSRENLALDTENALYRLPDKMQEIGHRIGEDDRFWGPLTTSWALVEKVRLLTQSEKKIHNLTAMYRTQVQNTQYCGSLPKEYAYWSVDI